MIDKKHRYNNFGFKMMAFFFGIRNIFNPPKKILEEIEIKKGFNILDYGSGTGCFSYAVSKMVGKKGKVYSLDIQKIAVESIKSKSIKKNLKNIETIHSDCSTGLSNEHIDIALLYDIYHDLSKPYDILKEIHRVLKKESILSFSDHHMEENEILSSIEKSKLFTLCKKGKKTYTFVKK